MARAVSTVLDVAICLLLVGAAVATLLAAPQPDHPSVGHDADSTASEVATVTTTVEAGAGRGSHDTLAGHLGTAAVANAHLDGAPVVDGGYPVAVANETDSLTGHRISVTARWEPYPDAPLVGTVSAGERPPPDADVAARTLTIDSGIEGSDRVNSFDGIARSLADAYVAWLFPPERTYANLVDDRTAPRTTDRYRSAAERLEADVTPSVAERDVRSANDRLAVSLARRLASDLRDRYGTPEAAAANVTVDEVELVVRRWDP